MSVYMMSAIARFRTKTTVIPLRLIALYSILDTITIVLPEIAIYSELISYTIILTTINGILKWYALHKILVRGSLRALFIIVSMQYTLHTAYCVPCCAYTLLSPFTSVYYYIQLMVYTA